MGRAPNNLREPCPPLERLNDSKPLLAGDLVQADVDASHAYQECAKKVEGWIRWEAGVLGRKVKGPAQ